MLLAKRFIIASFLLLTCSATLAQDGVFRAHAYADKYYTLTVTGETAVLLTPEGARIDMKRVRYKSNPSYISYKGGNFWKGHYTAVYRPNGIYKGGPPAYSIKKG